MALAYEANTDLAYDTDALRACGKEYVSIATDLREMAKQLNELLRELSESGWTTEAGKNFQKMAENNWEQNIALYASLLETFDQMLRESADKYDALTREHIEKTILK